MARAGLIGSYGPRHRAKPFKLVPPDPSEDQLQKSIADLLEWILPEEVAWSHFPAGGYQLTRAAQARLLRLGLKRGFPDLMICYGRLKMLWMEVKTPTGVVSKQQEKRHAQLQALGHVVVVVRSVEQVLQALLTYGVPIRRARLDRSYHGTQGDAGAAASGTKEPAKSIVRMDGQRPSPPQIGRRPVVEPFTFDF